MAAGSKLPRLPRLLLPPGCPGWPGCGWAEAVSPSTNPIPTIINALVQRFIEGSLSTIGPARLGGRKPHHHNHLANGSPPSRGRTAADSLVSQPIVALHPALLPQIFHFSFHGLK
jgi:hypothetical protein